MHKACGGENSGFAEVVGFMSHTDLKTYIEFQKKDSLFYFAPSKFFIYL